jgi:hypothetical protein
VQAVVALLHNHYGLPHLIKGSKMAKQIEIERLPAPKIRHMNTSQIREFWRHSAWGFPKSLARNDWQESKSFSRKG